MIPTNNLSPEHERLRRFMVRSVAIFDPVYDYRVRSWALKYAMVIRDRVGLGIKGLVDPPMPVGTGMIKEMEAIREGIDEAARIQFGKEAR